MEILHFEDLGDSECRLAVNAVVLVLGGYRISTHTQTLIYLISSHTSVSFPGFVNIPIIYLHSNLSSPNAQSQDCV